MEKCKEMVNQYRDDMIRCLGELVSIRSVESQEKPGMPFGEGVNQALEYILALAEKLGFPVSNADGYAGHADLGSGDSMVGILVHLDVVPEGTGWSVEPFGGSVVENRLYGRGAYDNKGPVIASLFAMKAIMDSQVKLTKKVRLIFGTHEESAAGWSDLAYYFSKYPRPDIGFSPDAQFPVIYGEKGLLNFSLDAELSPDDQPVQLKSLTGGNAPNMVPDCCQAELSVQPQSLGELKRHFSTYMEEHQAPLSMEMSDTGEAIIRSTGVSAHASRPELGDNAISHMMIYLADLPGLNVSASSLAQAYARNIGMEFYGESMGCGFEDDVSGKLTVNAGMVKKEGDSVSLRMNIRYPISVAGDTVKKEIQKSFSTTGIVYQDIEDTKPLYVREDDELVVGLMEAYRNETKDYKSKPLTIGGGTYARALPKGVAFGPRFPGREDVAHQKDEYIDIDDLIASARIYAEAICTLAK